MHDSRISIQRCYKALPRRGGVKCGIPISASLIGAGLCRILHPDFREVYFPDVG
jgi:hypothetical protein